MRVTLCFSRLLCCFLGGAQTALMFSHNTRSPGPEQSEPVSERTQTTPLQAGGQSNTHVGGWVVTRQILPRRLSSSVATRTDWPSRLLHKYLLPAVWPQDGRIRALGKAPRAMLSRLPPVLLLGPATTSAARPLTRPLRDGRTRQWPSVCPSSNLRVGDDFSAHASDQRERSLRKLLYLVYRLPRKECRCPSLHRRHWPGRVHTPWPSDCHVRTF